MKLSLFVLTGITLLSSVSCTTRIADFTVVSTKNMDLNHSKGYYTSLNDRISGIDKNHILICVPTNPQLSWKEAVDKAIESRNSCVGLSNATIEMGTFYIPLLYGETWYKVEGDLIYLRR